MSSQEIAGRYRLEGRLGFGGMSTVHLAFDSRLEHLSRSVWRFRGGLIAIIDLRHGNTQFLRKRCHK